MRWVRRVWIMLLHVAVVTALVGCFQVPPEPDWQGEDVVDVSENPDQLDSTEAGESGLEDAGDGPCIGKNCPPDVCEGAQCDDIVDPPDADVDDPPDACEPSCDDKACGEDGCGGVCGSCDVGEECGEAGQCECVPACDGKLCGDDGCGGPCGECADGEACSDAGLCECVSQCEGKACGDDSCGNSCGDCDEGEACTEAGECKCVPQCEGKNCGDDGCGGVCGTCDPDVETCSSQQLCECAQAKCGSTCCQAGQACHLEQDACCDPGCGGQACGLNACGESCGTCEPNEACEQDACVCVPDCENKECGGDGCGGFCSPNECGVGSECSGEGQCECVASSCGDVCCQEGDVCHQESCCTPDCNGQLCGQGDGCGGICTACAGASELPCYQGVCPVDESSQPQASPIPCDFDDVKVDGTVCDDGNACTLDDACENGNCTGPVCPGSTPCKTVYCDNFNGADQCAVSYAPVGADCEDGDFCTENDQCESPQDNVVTVCLGADISCDDGNPCTNDTCVPTGECTYEPALEGVSCNTAGVCIQGECCQDSCIGSGSCVFSSCGTACGTCSSEGSTCVESTCVATEVPTGMQLVQPGLSELGCSDSGESEACDLAFIEGDESPEVFVYLSAFAIDTFEVTVGDFDAFLIDIGGVDVSCGSVQPGPCVALNEAAWANLVSQGLFLPASHVTWLGASEYCASKSRRLCTEAEWEKAARGAGGKWPWGVSPDPNLEAPCVFASHGGVCGSGPSVIGTYQDGASAIGAHDMAGNVAEWTADTYAADIYQSYVDSGLITYNPTGSLSGQGIRVLRGGSFASPLKDLTTTARAFAPFDLQGVDSPSSTPGVVLGADEIGFRCCADVEIPSSP